MFDENGANNSEQTGAAIRNDANQMGGTWGIPGILTIDRDGAEDAGQNVTNFRTNADVSSNMVCNADISTGGLYTTYNVCSTANIPAYDQAMTYTCIECVSCIKEE